MLTKLLKCSSLQHKFNLFHFGIHWVMHFQPPAQELFGSTSERHIHQLICEMSQLAQRLGSSNPLPGYHRLPRATPDSILFKSMIYLCCPVPSGGSPVFAAQDASEQFFWATFLLVPTFWLLLPPVPSWRGSSYSLLFTKILSSPCVSFPETQKCCFSLSAQPSVIGFLLMNQNQLETGSLSVLHAELVDSCANSFSFLEGGTQISIRMQAAKYPSNRELSVFQVRELTLRESGTHLKAQSQGTTTWPHPCLSSNCKHRSAVIDPSCLWNIDKNSLCMVLIDNKISF